MESVSSIKSLAIPLPMKDVDTDLIIPAQFLTSTSRSGYGQNLFARLKESDRTFPLHSPKYKGASILLADSNFGCGSSREHAVWALLDAGIKAVIAKSFADIFYNNSAKNGLLLVQLPEPVVDRLLQAASKQDLVLEIDLSRQIVCVIGEAEFSFHYDPFRKHCLLNGLDDIDYILSFKREIEEFRCHQEISDFRLHTSFREGK